MAEIKQYRWKEINWPYYDFFWYIDGKQIKSKKIDQLEINEYIKEAENQGYSFAYTKEELERAKENYEKILANQLIFQPQRNWVIYKHTDPNNKSYIGLTCQTPEERWDNGNGYKTGKFAEAIKDLGWHSFTHEIIEDGIITLEEAQEKEKYWINYYDSYNNGYNSTFGGESSNTKIKPVYQIDKDLNIVALYNSVHEAAEKIGVVPETIYNLVCPGTKKFHHTAGGYYWVYVENYSNWTPSINKVKKTIYCPETDKFYESQAEAGRELNIDRKSISKVCTGKINSTHGYHFILVEKEKINNDTGTN